jgi:hypothetical protein
MMPMEYLPERVVKIQQRWGGLEETAATAIEKRAGVHQLREKLILSIQERCEGQFVQRYQQSHRVSPIVEI